MSYDPRAEERVARGLEDQRRRHAQFAAMMNELDSASSDSSESDDEAIPGRGSRPVRGLSLSGVKSLSISKPSTGTPGTAGSYSSATPGASPYTSASSWRTDGGGGGGDAFDKEFKASSAAVEPSPRDAGKKDKDKDKDYRVVANPKTMRNYLYTPASKSIVQCYVVRKKGLFKSPLYLVFLEGSDQFIMAGQKRRGKRTSNILIAMDSRPTDRKSEHIVAKLRSNWTGSGYVLFDNGLSPKKTVSQDTVRREFAFVGFEYDTMGPGKVTAALPKITPAGRPVELRPTTESYLSAAFEKRDHENMIHLYNKRPQWDETIKGHVLNFGGRVTQSSVKNFQLTGHGFGDETLLQFGRVEKHKFTMDFRYPLSPVQAFGIVLSSLDGKVADSKGFELINKMKKKKK